MRTTALIVAALAALTGCAKRPGPGLRIDPALAAMVPPEAVILAGVKAETLRSTEFYRRCLAARIKPQLDDFTRRTGLDPRKDIGELLVASNGRSTLVMARGKFSPARLEPAFNQARAQRFPYQGYTLIGSEQAAIVFMNATTVLAGSGAALRQALDRREKGPGPPKTLVGLASALPAASQIWMVAVGPFDHTGLPNPRAGQLSLPPQLLGSIATAAGWAELHTSANLTLKIVAFTAADARRLHDTARGLIGLGRLSTPDGKREFLRVYDAITVQQREREVLVNANIPIDLIDSLGK